MQDQNRILRIKDYVELPYIYNNHDLAINGATAIGINSIVRKPVIRLKNYQKCIALNGLTSMIGNSNNNNNSIKGASVSVSTSSMQKPNHKYNLKLNLISNNPIINYVNRMNQKVMKERYTNTNTKPCPCNNNKNAMIKGASISVTDKQEGIEALQGLSNMLR